MSLELAQTVLEIAARRIGIREVGRNRGPEIDEWLYRVGLDPERGAYPWCAAFAWCVLDDACRRLRVPNPVLRSARVVTLWRRTPSRLVALMPRPGSIYCHADRPTDIESNGHCGIVQDVAGDHIVGIEGNTNAAGEREGDQVATHIRRFDWVNLGYIDLERS